MFRLWLVALQARKHIYQQKNLMSHETDHGPQNAGFVGLIIADFSKAFWFLVLLIGFCELRLQCAVGRNIQWQLVY
ncbi:hypothetical protein PVAP13_7NG403225 [Panicum virgatum]|uniref:Uncharacterized protein n=1 Tax=Panicum virgatum TaxID=38727 RepID=A0A8T0Q6D1_PANVG|nr:hypothetical protein PVAP13_7NG403225 [Panicum virgatum]